MSDTPRTDVVLIAWDMSPEPKVLIEHARQLERELAAANRKIQRMKNAAEIILESCPTTWQEDVWNAAKEEKL